MTKTPNLGETWKEAIQSAYIYGYNQFDNSHAEIVEIAREKADEMGFKDALHEMINSGDFQAFVSNGVENRRLWWAIDDFYESEMPQEEYERLQREAAVAEDIDAAFEAGAHDAIFGREKDVTRVSHFYGE